MEKTRTLVLLGVGGSRRAQKRYGQDIATTREAILGLGQDSNTITIFAKVRELLRVQRGKPTSFSLYGGQRAAYLVSTHFKLGGIPARILVCRASDVAPRRFVRRNVAMYIERQLDYVLSVCRRRAVQQPVTYTSITHGVHASQPRR